LAEPGNALVAQRQPEAKAMPRDGAIVLSDLKDDGLAVRCAACGRSGRYSVKRLQRGDLKLTYFLAQVTADCPKRRAGGFHDTCKARFKNPRCSHASSFLSNLPS
jgi:hypothetical protein